MCFIECETLLFKSYSISIKNTTYAVSLHQFIYFYFTAIHRNYRLKQFTTSSRYYEGYWIINWSLLTDSLLICICFSGTLLLFRGLLSLLLTTFPSHKTDCSSYVVPRPLIQVLYYSAYF